MRIKSPLTLCALLSFTGCVTQKSLMISPTTLGPEQEEVVGVVTARVRVNYIPIVSAYSPLGDDAAPMNAAFKKALAGKNAHSLVNVAADRRCVFIPFPIFYFYARCELRVTGTAVRYKNLKTKDFLEEISRRRPAAAPVPSETKESDSQETSAAEPQGQALYGELLAEYRNSYKDAARRYVRLSNADKSSLKEYALRVKGAVSGKRRFLVSRNLPPVEKRFVLWLLSGRSKYRPIIR